MVSEFESHIRFASHDIATYQNLGDWQGRRKFSVQFWSIKLYGGVFCFTQLYKIPTNDTLNQQSSRVFSTCNSILSRNLSIYISTAITARSCLTTSSASLGSGKPAGFTRSSNHLVGKCTVRLPIRCFHSRTFGPHWMAIALRAIQLIHCHFNELICICHWS